MRREIAEQGDAVAATLEEVRRRAEQVRGAVVGRRRILFVARGSSDNAAVYGRYLVETQLGVPAALAAPSVATHYHARLDLSDTLVVSDLPVRADRGDRRGPALGAARRARPRSRSATTRTARWPPRPTYR